jgi:hypothetical protein
VKSFKHANSFQLIQDTILNANGHIRTRMGSVKNLKRKILETRQVDEFSRMPKNPTSLNFAYDKEFMMLNGKTVIFDDEFEKSETV